MRAAAGLRVSHKHFGQQAVQKIRANELLGVPKVIFANNKICYGNKKRDSIDEPRFTRFNQSK